jgi:hypothetical protein
MTLLNTADAVRFGTVEVLAVHLGGTPVWTPTPLGGTFGDTGTGGGGNWPTAADRAIVGGPYTVPVDAEITELHLSFRTATDAGLGIKGIVILDNPTGEGSVLSVGTQTLTLAGVHTLILPVSAIVTAGQSIWLGGVANASGGEMDSGGTDTIGTRLYNGTFSYASAPSTAPADSITYGNRLACWATYSGV